MPKHMLRLKPSTYCVFLYLEKQCELTGTTDMSILEYLQNMPFQISVITLMKALKELQEKKIIIKTKSVRHPLRVAYSINKIPYLESKGFNYA
jgi:hypothetical protein